MSPLVVGTAGHIDHGKSSLVRRLTGVDPDRLPEEQARGITIALGFAPLKLENGRTIGFVDVPGHEKLVRTMVSGATGLDAVLLCVSAVDGVMPQTREHLAILDLLGVRQGAVVITCADLVDADMLELAHDDVKTLVAGTFLAGAPSISWSSLADIGQSDLLAVLAAFSPVSRAKEGVFRLPVDRTFVQTGFGTVVTGTTWSGTLADGAAVTIWPDGISARVRGMQVHGLAVDAVAPGQRVALNLAGIDREEVGRGTVVSDGPLALASILDVRYTQLAGDVLVEDGMPIRVLHGTTERLGKLALAESGPLEPGNHWVQLRLDRPLPCLPGDHFIVRRPSPETTLGGGVILDPWAPKLRARDHDLFAAHLGRLAKGDTSVFLERAGESGIDVGEWAWRGTGGVVLGDRVFAATVVARLDGVLLEALERYHRDQPLAQGANRRELRRERLGHLSEATFDALIDRLATAGAVAVEGPLLRFGGFSVALSHEQKLLRDKLRAAISGAGFEGIALKALAERFPEKEAVRLVQLLEASGTVVQVSALGWVGSEVLEELRTKIAAFFATHPELTPGDFKDVTGLSRKGAIPWLEWLDKARITKRVGDVRQRGPAIGG